jgi:hypothetical protein
MEHLSRLQELELVCSATTMIVNIMRGKSTTTMSYTYLTTIKGTPLEAQPGLFSYRIDDSLLSDVEIWQLQVGGVACGACRGHAKGSRCQISAYLRPLAAHSGANLSRLTTH